jgi:hypothetical protein
MGQPIGDINALLRGVSEQADDLKVELPPFVGAAKALIEELAGELVGVTDPAGVMLAGLGLLARARGKDVLLRNRETREVSRVDIWKARA